MSNLPWDVSDAMIDAAHGASPAYEAGVKAAEAGLGRDDNPFADSDGRLEPIAYDDWGAGWLDTKQKQEAES